MLQGTEVYLRVSVDSRRVLELSCNKFGPQTCSRFAGSEEVDRENNVPWQLSIFGLHTPSVSYESM